MSSIYELSVSCHPTSLHSVLCMCDRGNARAFIKDLERVRPTAIIG